LTDHDRDLLDHGALDDHIGIQIHITRRAIWQQARSDRLQRKTPPGYVSTLILIGANPGVSQKRIANELFLDAGTIVEIIDLLEADQLAERRRDPADRRRQLIHLTDKGLLAWAQARDATRAAGQELAARLTPHEARELTRLLRKVRR
jgi:DNA-binding MarR family transcriptional regulator